MGGEFQFFEDAVFEGCLVEDNLVGRRDGDGGIFVETQDAVDSPSYARRGVSLHGLYDELVVADVWELFADEGGIVVVGRDEDVVLGQNLHKPVVGLLQQRAARTEKVKELFRLVLATGGPKAQPASSGEYDTVVVVRCSHHLFKVSVEHTKVLINLHMSKIFKNNQRKICFLQINFVPLHPH